MYTCYIEQKYCDFLRHISTIILNYVIGTIYEYNFNCIEDNKFYSCEL